MELWPRYHKPKERSNFVLCICTRFDWLSAFVAWEQLSNILSMFFSYSGTIEQLAMFGPFLSSSCFRCCNFPSTALWCLGDLPSHAQELSAETNHDMAFPFSYLMKMSIPRELTSRRVGSRRNQREWSPSSDQIVLIVSSISSVVTSMSSGL